jgi:hypothetical protein
MSAPATQKLDLYAGVTLNYGYDGCYTYDNNGNMLTESKATATTTYFIATLRREKI